MNYFDARTINYFMSDSEREENYQPESDPDSDKADTDREVLYDTDDVT